MKNKIFATLCLILLLVTTFLTSINAEEITETTMPLFNSKSLSHIKIEGSGSSIIIASSFVLGFGRCAYMRLNLNEDSQIEINKFLDQSDIETLEGEYVITMFGFIGYYRETEDKITLNGFSALVFWR